MNAQSRYSPEEVMARGKAIYDAQIRPQVEKEGNWGKLVSIEVFTGDYEMGDSHVETTMRLRNRHVDPVIATLRIGYRAAFTRSGRMTPDR
jgi:hypothetical protein